uniref:Protein kinase domain-containing protein n=1 Tax=Haemonchus contortus TaxID=6289 RepID=A0A7I5EDD5_HAECO
MSEAPKPPAKVGPASAIASARRDVSQLIEDLIRDLDKKLSDSQENQPNRSRSRSLTPAVTQATGRTRSASSSDSNVQTAKSHTPYKSRFTSGIPGSSPGHVAVATAVRDNSAFSDTSAGSERVATALSPTAQMQQTLENEPVKRTPVTTETRRGRSPTVRSNVNSQANLKSYTNKVSTSRSPFSRATARSTTPRTATNTERTARPLLAGEQTMDALRRGKLFGRSKTPARAASARTSTTTPSTSTSEYMSNEVKTAAAIGTPCGRTLELSDEKKSQEVGIDDFLHKPASDQQKQLASPSHSGATPHTRRKEEVSLQSLWLLDSAQHPQDQDSLQTARARTPLDARARAGSGSLAYQSQSPLRTAIEDSMSPTPGVTTAAEIPMSPTPGVNTAIEETMSPTRGVDTAREISTAPRDPTNVFGTPQTDSTRTALPNFTPTSGVYTARSIDRTGSESIGPTGRIVQPQPRRLFGSDTYPRRSQSMQSDSSTSGNRTASIERRIALMRTRLYQQNQHHQAAPPISPYSSTSSSGPDTPEVRTARAIARRRGLFGPPSQLSQPSGGVRLGRLNRPSASTSSSAESGNRFRSGMFGQPSQIGTTSDTTSSAGIRVTFPERSLDSAGVTSTPAQNTPSGFTSSQQSRLPVLVRETTTPGLQRSTSSHLTDAPMGTAIPGSTSDGTARQFTTDGSFPSRSLSSEGSRPDSTGSELLGSGPQSRSKKIRPKRRILRRPDTRVTYYGGMRKPKRINKRDLKQRRRAIALMTPMLSEDRTQVVSPDTQSDRRRDETSASTRTAIGSVNTDLAEAIAKVTQQELESGNIVIHEQNPDGTFKLELHLSCRTTSPRGHLNISGHAPVGLRPKKVMINGKEVWVEN